MDSLMHYHQHLEPKYNCHKEGEKSNLENTHSDMWSCEKIEAIVNIVDAYAPSKTSLFHVHQMINITKWAMLSI